MIDILVDAAYDASQVTDLMAALFALNQSQIVVCTLDDLAEITVADEVSCLCVLSHVAGDVQTLLSLYRVRMDFDALVHQLRGLSDVFQDTFFVPHDDLNAYLKIHRHAVQKVMLDEPHFAGQFVFRQPNEHETQPV